MLYWRVMDIRRRPVELQIFTCYAKSGGVGSNPAQGNISFAHFSDRKICLSFPGTKYLDPWCGIMILAICVASSSNKISDSFLHIFQMCKKYIDPSGIRTHATRFGTCGYLQLNRSPSNGHSSPVHHGNWSLLCNIVSYKDDFDLYLEHATWRY